MILIGSSNWGAFEGDLGDVHWIPSKCGTFGGHLGGHLGGDLLSRYLDSFQLGDFWTELWCS